MDFMPGVKLRPIPIIHALGAWLGMTRLGGRCVEGKGSSGGAKYRRTDEAVAGRVQIESWSLGIHRVGRILSFRRAAVVRRVGHCEDVGAR